MRRILHLRQKNIFLFFTFIFLMIFSNVYSQQNNEKIEIGFKTNIVIAIAILASMIFYTWLNKSIKMHSFNYKIKDVLKSMKRLRTLFILQGIWESSFFVAIPSAVLAGIWAGTHRDSRGDRVMSTVSMVAISLPEFVTGMLLIIIFSSILGLLPSSSIILPGTTPLTRPQILVMPALTLTGVMFGYIMRMTRANVIEVMQSNYIRAAILKGLPMRRVIFRHAVPNAMLPTISIIASSIGWLLGGLIVVEVVFAYPGLGRLLLDSISTRDLPLLQVVTLIIAATYTFSNLAADISYAALDRRVRLS